MNYIRLKSFVQEKEIYDRLQYNPAILELILTEKDIYYPDVLEYYLRLLRERGISVYLRHPETANGQFLSLLANKEKTIQFYKTSTALLTRLCRQYDMHCVIQTHYASDASRLVAKTKNEEKMAIKLLTSRIKEINALPGSHFLLWKDTPHHVFSLANDHVVSELIKPLQLNIAVDFKKLYEAVKKEPSAFMLLLETLKKHIKYVYLSFSTEETGNEAAFYKEGLNLVKVASYLKETPFMYALNEQGQDKKEEHAFQLAEAAFYKELFIYKAIIKDV